MKCKNCEHENPHKYNRVECHHFNCDCKQFIPQEENIKLIDKVEAHYERTKENKGCGKKIPIGNMFVICGETTELGLHLCPSCSIKKQAIKEITEMDDEVYERLTE